MTDTAGEISSDHLSMRAVVNADLSIFFEHQLDSEANFMAAFTAKDPSDEKSFMERWHQILLDESIQKNTILVAQQIAGHVVCFEQFGRREVSYWLGREFWGRGIATEALAQFLGMIDTRPLFARAAKDNIASIRVLEKNGFVITGEDKGFANGRGEEIEEFILKLQA